MATIGETNNLKSENKNEKRKDNKEGQGSDSEDPTQGELDVVTAVFKTFETGLREGTMLPKVGQIHA